MRHHDLGVPASPNARTCLMAFTSPNEVSTATVSTVNGWNIADILEEIAEALPESLALAHGDVAISWNEMNHRANGIAQELLDSGLVEQDKVAQYLYNSPHYIESVLASFKAGMAIVNTNYRYAADELVYLWDNADVCAVVFHATFCPQIEEINIDCQIFDCGFGSTMGHTHVRIGPSTTNQRRRQGHPTTSRARGDGAATI